MEQINQNMNAGAGPYVSLKQVSAKEFAAKFKSKRECYNFLAAECEVYLPPYGKYHAWAILMFIFFQITSRSTS